MSNVGTITVLPSIDMARLDIRLKGNSKQVLDEYCEQEVIKPGAVVSGLIQEHLAPKLDVLPIPLCKERSLKLKQYCDRTGEEPVKIIQEVVQEYIEGLGVELN